MSDSPVVPFRLLHVASGDLWAGAEVQLYHLARALHRRNDVELRVILLNPGELALRLAAAGIAVEVIDERAKGFLAVMQTLRAEIRTWQPHVVHSHRYKENLLCALATRGTGGVAVRTIHSAAVQPHGWRGHGAALADRLAARMQDWGVCVSQDLLAHAHARYRVLNIEVIENGIDAEELQAGARTPVDESLLGAGLRVGFIGRLVPIKRPDLMLAAAHHLVTASPGRFSFHFFGDGPLRTECERFVAQQGLSDSVRLLGFRSDLPAWLARMDALVLCSDHEGLPMVLLEAMALGVPVVAHAVGGMPPVLGLGECGFLVREHTPHGYETALRAIADHPDEAALRAERAREQIRNRYTATAVAERYMALYRNLLSAPVAARRVAFD